MKTPPHVPAIRRSLLAWYRRHARDLPWRRTDDPYAVWLSEIMLQQTQVETVKRYYGRFLERFPTVRGLAKAPLDDVLKCWEGMGYYTRARNLHKAAKVLVKDFDGAFPTTTEAWRKLPGIGRYTAGAIVSIAFGGDEPVLDGNVVRVLCRVFRVRSDPKSAATLKRLWTLAERLLPPGEAGNFNQAMMDLGATICTPRSPDCPVCPLRTFCEARKRSEQHRLPAKTTRKPVPHEDIVVGIVRKGGHILIDRRKPEGLLGGLWEFPGGKIEKGETMREALVREVREETGVEVEAGRHLLNVRHAYTHLRVTLHAFEVMWRRGRARALGCSAVRWVRTEELDRFAFPAATLRIIEALRRRNL